MPIVQHELISNPQADGSTYNFLKMYDQEANVYEVAFSAPAGFDLATRVQVAISEMNTQLAENEFQALLNGG